MKQTILIILILFSSCEAQRATRKLNWLKDRGYIVTDTIHLVDTFMGFKVDTLYIGTKEVDTFTLIKDNVQVRTIVRWRTKTATQELIVRDTIFKRVHKVLTKTIKEKRTWWDRFSIGFSIGILIFAAIVLLSIKIK